MCAEARSIASRRASEPAHPQMVRIDRDECRIIAATHRLSTRFWITECLQVAIADTARVERPSGARIWKSPVCTTRIPREYRAPSSRPAIRRL